MKTSTDYIRGLVDAGKRFIDGRWVVTADVAEFHKMLDHIDDLQQNLKTRRNLARMLWDDGYFETCDDETCDCGYCSAIIELVDGEI